MAACDIGLLRLPADIPPTYPPPTCRSYAVSNTRRGIETCGILAGELSADDAVFTITTLIVPKQEGTTDTVSRGLGCACSVGGEVQGWREAFLLLLALGGQAELPPPRCACSLAPQLRLCYSALPQVEMLNEEEIFEVQDRCGPGGCPAGPQGWHEF